MANGRLEKETIEFNKIENKLKSLPKIFGDYYYTLRAEKKSYRTIEEYINSVKHFMEFFTDGKTDPEFYKKVSTMDINRYLISLETKVVGGQTVPTSSGFRFHRWASLNSFFEFLVDIEKLEKNPVSKKSRPKVTDNPSVTYLTEDEIRRIIEKIKKEAKNSMVNRDLCLFMLGVTTGLRVAATTQINMEDIDFNKGVIHVVEKRNKVFDVIIGKNLMAVLKAWIADRQIYFSDAETNALFISQHGKRISYDAVRKLWIKYTEGITDKKITPHCLRHTCATNLYEKTGDIYLASAQLHHSNISTTMRYAEISDKKLQKANSILDDMV